ncbi:MAG TPA: hypothetical protein VF942_14785, partial [Acidimicrobiales bacterium]
LAVSVGVAIAMAPVRFWLVAPEPIRLVLAIVAGLAGALVALLVIDRRLAGEVQRLLISPVPVHLAVEAK